MWCGQGSGHLPPDSRVGVTCMAVDRSQLMRLRVARAARRGLYLRLYLVSSWATKVRAESALSWAGACGDRTVCDCGVMLWASAAYWRVRERYALDRSARAARRRSHQLRLSTERLGAAGSRAAGTAV